MQIKRLITILIALALACTSGAAAQIEINDMKGREIILPAPAERVVALSAADCEIIYAIGAGDKLVGRGEYCFYPPEVMQVPSVQSGYETNVEQILALAPDVVVMSTMAQSKDVVDLLERAGIYAVVSEAFDIQGVYESIRLLGALMDMPENADSVIQAMNAAFSEASEGKIGAGKSVYFEVSPLVYGLWTAGSGTFMNEIASMLGLVNCFEDVEGWAQISEEQVIARNPDYIVTITPYYGGDVTPAEEILSREGWQNVSAVQNAAILNLVNDELSRPSPSLAEGARLLSEFIKGQ